MIKLIIFDWDDTIVLGAKEGYYDCYRGALKAVGVRLDEKTLIRRIKKRWGKKHQIEIKGLLKEYPDKVSAAIKEFKHLSFGTTFFNQLKFLPGTRKLLKDLEKKYILAVVTGSDLQRMRLSQGRLKLGSTFKQIVSSHNIKDPKKTKPHPYMVKLILEKQRVKPEEALLVGDSRQDILMAKAAGLRTVAVLTGHLTKKEAKDLKVDKIIPDVTYLKTFLKEEEIF